MTANIEPTSQDVIVEDNDSLIQYGPSDKWSESRDTNIIEFGTTYHLTGALGAWAALSFSGTRIWYFADRLNNHGNFGASIDGGPTAVYSSFNTALLKGQMLFYAQLPPGRHTINITNLEDTKVVGVDRFVYRPLGIDADSLSTTTSGAGAGPTPGRQQSDNQEQSQTSSRSSLSAGAYVGIGLASGAIALLLVLVGAFLWTRRRHQPPPQWDAGSINAAQAARPWQGPPSRQWSQFSASQPQQPQPQPQQQGAGLPAYDASSHSRSAPSFG